MCRSVCRSSPVGEFGPLEHSGQTFRGRLRRVLVIDECQLAFDDDPEMVALVTDLGKRGPAAGIIVLLATQRVDAKSLPTAISSNAVLRLCFKVAGQVENDMVLGTSMYKAGVRATTFARTDRGVGYLAGEGDEPVIVRAAYLDAPAAETVTARARAARLAAGLLTGHAAGLDPDPDDSTASILDHLATVWPPGEDKVWWDDLAERLAATYPRPLRRLDRGAGHRRRPAPRPEVDPDQTHRRRQRPQPPRPRPHRPHTALDDRTDGDYAWPAYIPPPRDDTTPLA